MTILVIEVKRIERDIKFTFDLDVELGDNKTPQSIDDIYKSVLLEVDTSMDSVQSVDKKGHYETTLFEIGGQTSYIVFDKKVLGVDIHTQELPNE